jgi:hypothetical protein
MSDGGRAQLILPFWLLVFGVFRFAFDHRRVRPKGVQERLAWLVKLVCPWHEPSDFREMTSRSIP